MQCPVCDVTLTISSREGVEIDFCPQCRGVWLDRGELDKVIDRAAAVLQAARSEPPVREPAPVREDRYDRYDDRYERRDRSGDRYDDRDDPRRKRKKKRRFELLEDLFDFD